MSLKKITCVVIKCDQCLNHLGNFDWDILYIEEGEVEDALTDQDWCETPDGAHYCYDCADILGLGSNGLPDEEKDEGEWKATT